MDAVILASGEGMRMRPLSLATPKPLLEVAGAPILDHFLHALPESVTRIVLTVHYLSEQFKERYGDKYEGREVLYVEGSRDGSAVGFLKAEPLVRGERFIVAYADDLPAREDIARCLKEHESILCFKSPDSRLHGMTKLREDGSISEIVEKPPVWSDDRAANGCMVLTRGIFACTPTTAAGELYFSTLLNAHVAVSHVMPVMEHGLIWGITTPDDLPRAEQQLYARYAKRASVERV